MTALPPYVDLHEAVRVAVRLLPPDGEILASKITNEWIADGYGRWNSDSYLEDDVSMVRLYGQDWRAMRPRVIGAFDKAVGLLRQLLRMGRIHGVGVSDTMPESGSREIAPHEWSRVRLNIGRGILEAAHHPAIRAVLVSAEDLTRECTAIVAPPNWRSNQYKREAVDATIERFGLASLAAMQQTPREEKIIKVIANEHGGLTVTPRYVRERWKEAKERGVPKRT